ncbi:rubrerythrin-like domain-containing protein [Halorubrum saccharovorum]|nr:rubrerythrin-like domain-containing protein [Halorubrum saccharovorum]
MKDIEVNPDKKSPYECFECGDIVESVDSPNYCPDCGGQMRNRLTPIE